MKMDLTCLTDFDFFFPVFDLVKRRPVSWETTPNWSMEAEDETRFLKHTSEEWFLQLSSPTKTGTPSSKNYHLK